MKSKNQIAIERLVSQHAKELKQVQIQIRTDLLEVMTAISSVTGKSLVEQLEELQDSIAFRIRLIKGIRKRKVGRPKLNKGNK
jgi:hypothetical protein